MTQSSWQPSFRDPDGSTVVLEDRVLRFLRGDAFRTLGEFETTASGTQLLGEAAILSWRAASDLDMPREFPVDKWGHVLEQDKIAFPSFPHEWPAGLLRRSGEQILNIQSRIIDDGFRLKDASPYNILFEGVKPVLVDALSVERRPPGDVLWRADAQFTRTILLPLLAHKHLGLPPHRFFIDGRDGLTPEEVYAWISPLRRFNPDIFRTVTLPVWLTPSAERREGRLYDTPAVNPERATFTLKAVAGRLSRQLARTGSGRRRQSHWSRYESEHGYGAEEAENKISFVESVLSQASPRAVLDIGCNTGRYSVLAAQAGARVVAIDSDFIAVDHLYSAASRDGHDILPLVVDIARPTPATGWRNAEAPSFLARAENGFDLVMALALVHHLMVTERVPLAEVLGLLADLSRRHVLVEYVDPGDPQFQRLCRGREDLHRDVNETAFRDACRERFHIVDKAEVSAGRRTAYLLEVK